MYTKVVDANYIRLTKINLYINLNIFSVISMLIFFAQKASPVLICSDSCNKQLLFMFAVLSIYNFDLYYNKSAFSSLCDKPWELSEWSLTNRV